MNPVNWLLSLWDAYRRHIDIHTLWPCIKAHAKNDVEIARAAFYLHVQRDPAWRRLGPEKTLATVMELT